MGQLAFPAFIAVPQGLIQPPVLAPGAPQPPILTPNTWGTLHSYMQPALQVVNSNNSAAVVSMPSAPLVQNTNEQQQVFPSTAIPIQNIPSAQPMAHPSQTHQIGFAQPNPGQIDLAGSGG